jgi:hypothetical protein
MLNNTFINQNQENSETSSLTTIETVNKSNIIKAAGAVVTTGAATIGGLTLFSSDSNTVEEVTTPIEDLSSETITATHEECPETNELIEDHAIEIEDIAMPKSFNDAFAEARNTLGENATFEWNGYTYHTNYAQTNQEVIQYPPEQLHILRLNLLS